MGSEISAVLGDDTIVPFGNDVRGELGDRRGSDGLDNVVYANDVRLDLLHIRLNSWVGKCMLDERVRIRLHNGVMCLGNGVAYRRAGAMARVLADEKPVRGEPREVCFEGKTDETPKDTLLRFLVQLQVSYARWGIMNVH